MHGYAYQAIMGAVPAVVYDTAAQAYFDQITTNGGSITAGQKAAINAYIIAEKLAGNWTNQDAEYLFYSTDPLVAKVNLRQPSLYALTFNGTTTLSATKGFNNDGSTGYADTGINQSALVNMTQNNAHISTWALARGNFMLGLVGNAAGMQMSPGSTKSTRLTSATAVSDTSTAGYNWADRTLAATIVTGFGPSVQTALGVAVSAALIAAHVCIGRAGSSFMPINSNLVFAGFGGALNDEVARYNNLRLCLLDLGITVP